MLYTITDVEEVGAWMRSKLQVHHGDLRVRVLSVLSRSGVVAKCVSIVSILSCLFIAANDATVCKWWLAGKIVH